MGLIASAFGLGLADAKTCIGGAVYSDLLDFQSGITGQALYDGMDLIADSRGNLYGIASGTNPNFEYVFKLSPPASGSTTWTEEKLWTFQSNATDGRLLQNKLLIGPKGVVYGMAKFGGLYDKGTVFALTPPTKTTPNWTETILYNFGSASGDGGHPFQNALVLGPNGVLYGATQFGETVFQLTPPGANCVASAGNAWCQQVLYTFHGPDGAQPVGAMALDPNGHLYGATNSGGAGPVVFELTPPTTPGGAWTETVLANLGSIGINPYGGVVVDSSGNLYGALAGGGDYGWGTVFELSSPTTQGQPWTLSKLHSFHGGPNDGALPWGGVSIGSGGVLYGTTAEGGAGPAPGNGTLFALAPPAKQDAPWSESVVYNFPPYDGTTGGIPMGSVLIEKGGKVFGMTLSGGAYSAGNVWEIKLQ